MKIIVGKIKNGLGLSRMELSKILKVSPNTIGYWEKEGTLPRKANQIKLREIHVIYKELSKLYKPETILVWMDKENVVLDEKTPRQYLLDGGDPLRIVEELGRANK